MKVDVGIKYGNAITDISNHEYNGGRTYKSIASICTKSRHLAKKNPETALLNLHNEIRELNNSIKNTTYLLRQYYSIFSSRHNYIQSQMLQLILDNTLNRYTSLEIDVFIIDIAEILEISSSGHGVSFLEKIYNSIDEKNLNNLNIWNLKKITVFLSNKYFMEYKFERANAIIIKSINLLRKSADYILNNKNDSINEKIESENLINSIEDYQIDLKNHLIKTNERTGHDESAIFGFYYYYQTKLLSFANAMLKEFPSYPTYFKEKKNYNTIWSYFSDEDIDKYLGKIGKLDKKDILKKEIHNYIFIDLIEVCGISPHILNSSLSEMSNEIIWGIALQEERNKLTDYATVKQDVILKTEKIFDQLNIDTHAIIKL